MKREHILETSKEELEDWQKNTYIDFASSIGGPVTKNLRCYLIGLWEVIINDKVTYQGKDLELAIKHYNRFNN